MSVAVLITRTENGPAELRRHAASSRDSDAAPRMLALVMVGASRAAAAQLVAAKMVPAVSEVCRRPALHCNSPIVFTSLCVVPPQTGHSKPVGQRQDFTTARHFASLPWISSKTTSLRPF